MTSHFDDLMGIRSAVEKHPEFMPIANWVRDICVTEAESKTVKWSLAIFKENAPYYATNENEARWVFLNRTHSVLDHGNFHLRVFTLPTIALITATYSLLVESGEVFDRELHAMVTKKETFLGYAKRLGAEFEYRGKRVCHVKLAKEKRL